MPRFHFGKILYEVHCESYAEFDSLLYMEPSDEFKNKIKNSEELKPEKPYERYDKM